MNNRGVLVGILVVALVGVAWFTKSPKVVSSRPAQVAPPTTAGSSDAAAGDGAAVSSGSKVGFIDLETVYNTCKQTKAFDTEMATFMEGVRKKLEPLQEKLKKLDEDYKMLGPDAPNRKALEDEITKQQQEYRKQSEPEEKDLNRKSLKTREQIYGLIKEACAKVAKARGIDLVIADIEDPHADFKGETPRELGEALREYSVKMQRKAVLYGSREVDLTKEVRDAVNSEP